MYIKEHLKKVQSECVIWNQAEKWLITGINQSTPLVQNGMGGACTSVPGRLWDKLHRHLFA